MSNPETKSTETVPSDDGAASGSVGRLVRKFAFWKVFKELSDGSWVCGEYHSSCGPVTAEHVATAPGTKKWLGTHRLAMLRPPACPEYAVHFPNVEISHGGTNTNNAQKSC